MTEEQIGNILRVIGTANVSEEQRGSATADVLQLAAETFTKQVFASLLSAKPTEIKGEEEKAPQPRSRQKTGIRFTKQEMKKMPMKYRKIFAHEDIIVPYRLRKDGVYEARVRRKDLHIEVSARDFAALKEKFIRALHKEEEPAPAAVKDPKATNFGEFTLQWLEVKQALVKPSTFKEYDRLCRKNLIPAFGQYSLAQIDRDKLQSYLLGFVKEGKHRTAEKLADLLRCIFDVAADDYKIPSPMAKVVLPRYQTKKGSAPLSDQEGQCVHLRGRGEAGALLPRECG